MKAITICQPYASLIVGWDGVNAADVKRVENRTWPTRYRGPLLIHAGVSEKWLPTWDGPRPPADQMPMGKIVGIVQLVDCQSIASIRSAPARSPIAWLKSHVHATGPWCFVLRRPRRLLTPIAFRGQQGIFEVPDDLITAAAFEPQCRICGCTELDGCPGGCCWITENLCSRCGEKIESGQY
jgi:hypothetical protein